MKVFLLKFYYKFLELKDRITIFYNKNIVSKKKVPVVVNTDETITKITQEKVSVSRYGDGEFGLMQRQGLIFQPYSKELHKRLNEIIKSNNENHIVCIPNVFNELDIFNEIPKKYWNRYLELNRGKIYKLLDMNKKYYDTQVTRLYIDYKDKSSVKKRFDRMKELWKDRDILIVEGDKSRLGVGNDLFNNSNSIRRIICPSTDAFSKYKQILNEVKKQDKDTLVLIALGPTATVLAYDLSKYGHQAVDIGHIDIEYEWFLQGAIEKCPVKYKYIGEIDGGSNVDSIEDICYENQIIFKI